MNLTDTARVFIGIAGAWTSWQMMQMVCLYYKISNSGHKGVRPITVFLDRLGYMIFITIVCADISTRVGQPITWRTPIAGFAVGLALPAITALVNDLKQRSKNLRS